VSKKPVQKPKKEHKQKVLAKKKTEEEIDHE
jgi:hypothetical protein